jgi:hypothetical protein
MLRRDVLCLPILAVVPRGPALVVWSGGRKVTPTSIDVYAEDNANTRFTVFVRMPRDRDDDVALELAGTRWTAETHGHDDTSSMAFVRVDRAAARRIAAALGTTAAERTPLDGGLRTTWRIPAVATTSGPINVTLRIDNAGPLTVGLAIGGRQRGPRDNRFSFAIANEPIIDAPDFGGLMYYAKLAPGDHAEVACDLRSWATLATPGRYVVTATYEGELAKDAEMPDGPRDSANLWDIAVTTQGTITIVRP